MLLSQKKEKNRGMTILLFAQKPNNLYHFKILKNDLSDILNSFILF